MAILGTYFRFSISVREWIGAGGHRLRAGGLPLLRRPRWRRRGPDQPGLDRGRRQHRSSSSCVTVVATRWGPRWWKAAMFGSAAAIAYAFTAALIKDGQRLRGQRLGHAVRALADLRGRRLRAARPLPHAERLPRRPAGRVAVDPRPGRPAGQHLPRHRALRRQPAHLGAVRAPRGPLAPRHVHGRRLPLQLAADHGHEERGQGGRVRRDALPPAEAPPEHPRRGARARPDSTGRTGRHQDGSPPFGSA